MKRRTGYITLQRVLLMYLAALAMWVLQIFCLPQNIYSVVLGSAFMCYVLTCIRPFAMLIWIPALGIYSYFMTVHPLFKGQYGFLLFGLLYFCCFSISSIKFLVGYTKTAIIIRSVVGQAHTEQPKQEDKDCK